MSEPIILSWSGGKDSALMLAALRDDPRYEPVALLTTVTTGVDRIAIHRVRGSLLHAQASALRLPLHEVPLEPACTNDAYEAGFGAALLDACERYGARHVAFGDLFLEDVRSYRERLLARIDVAGVFPLWGCDTTALARTFVRDGFSARLVCVDTTALSGAFVGRSYDDALLAELPPTVDPCGERGEYHTFVSDGPGFHEVVRYIIGDTVVRDERFAYCDLLPFSTADQP